jgi:hypothetical protein
MAARAALRAFRQSDGLVDLADRREVVDLIGDVFDVTLGVSGNPSCT